LDFRRREGKIAALKLNLKALAILNGDGNVMPKQN
jgi:hypothetical protein